MYNKTRVPILPHMYVHQASFWYGNRKSQSQVNRIFITSTCQVHLTILIAPNQGLLEIKIYSYDSFKFYHVRPCSPHFLLSKTLNLTVNQNGIFVFVFHGMGYNSHTSFLHTLDFLGIKDLRKKRPRKFSKAIAKARDTFYRTFMTFLAYLDHFDITIQPIEAF